MKSTSFIRYFTSTHTDKYVKATKSEITVKMAEKIEGPCQRESGS